MRKEKTIFKSTPGAKIGKVLAITYMINPIDILQNTPNYCIG